jgi:hypothetical protein
MAVKKKGYNIGMRQVNGGIRKSQIAQERQVIANKLESAAKLITGTIANRGVGSKTVKTSSSGIKAKVKVETGLGLKSNKIKPVKKTIRRKTK